MKFRGPVVRIASGHHFSLKNTLAAQAAMAGGQIAWGSGRSRHESKNSKKPWQAAFRKC
jgi:hypothetical protein